MAYYFLCRCLLFVAYVNINVGLRKGLLLNNLGAKFCAGLPLRGGEHFGTWARFSTTKRCLNGAPAPGERTIDRDWLSHDP